MSVVPTFTAAEAYYDLCAYTLGRGDSAFIHQHVVDAFAAQNADERTKPIALTFALVGLHLHVDRGYSGKQVQRVHQQLAAQHPAWPAVPLPYERGAMTAADVMACPEGPERDGAIDAWCESAWRAYRASHAIIAGLLHQSGIE